MRPTGLRGRLLVALVATSAFTLLAMAAALLPRLQDRLREQSQETLQAAARTVRPQLEAALRRDPTLSRSADFELANRLAVRLNARVSVWDQAPYAEGGGAVFDSGTGIQNIDDVFIALATRTLTTTFTEQGLRLALPLRPYPRGDRREDEIYVLAIRKTNTDVNDAFGEVRNAFIAAAAVGLVAAAVLALILATTLSRRLGRLRRAALRFTREGIQAPMPRDDTRDEVGDLARAMAAMQVALRRQEDARRRFVATASHELRTPITSLSGTLELLGEDLAEGDLDREDALAQVHEAQGELRRLRTLATELLDLSRLDADVALRSEPVELGELTRAVGAEFGLQAHGAGVTLDIEPPIGPCWASGDPDAVARVVRILIDNALRYAPDGSAVRVPVGYQGKVAFVAVEDQGPGVPADEREVIFERFQRGSVTAATAGFGLGLAIGRELAVKQGGTLAYDLGHRGGARFVLTLPIELPQGARAPQPDHDAVA